MSPVAARKAILRISSPGCGIKTPHLSREGILGYCPKCSRWLGWKEDYDTRALSHLDYHEWVSEQIAYIVRTCQEGPNDIAIKLKNNLALMLSSYQNAGFYKKLASPFHSKLASTTPSLVFIRCL
jgi:hypothetical protein